MSWRVTSTHQHPMNTSSTDESKDDIPLHQTDAMTDDKNDKERPADDNASNKDQ